MNCNLNDNLMNQPMCSNLTNPFPPLYLDNSPELHCVGYNELFDCLVYYNHLTDMVYIDESNLFGPSPIRLKIYMDLADEDNGNKEPIMSEILMIKREQKLKQLL